MPKRGNSFGQQRPWVIGCLVLASGCSAGDPDARAGANGGRGAAASDDAATPDGQGGDGSLDSGDSSGQEPATCDELTLAGHLNGQPFRRGYGGGSGSADRIGTVWELRRAVPRDGLIHLVGTEYGEPSKFTDGVTHAVRGGFVLMPIEGPAPSSFVCANPGATASGDALGLHIEIPQARALGACPGGTPVAGEVHLCAEYNRSECTLAISGSLESIPFEDTYMGSWGIGGTGLFDTATGNMRGTRIHALLDRPPLDDPMGQVVGGFITTDSDGPHGGAIYCIGGGTFDYVDGGATRLTMTNLSKLGNCSPTSAGSNHISVCIPPR